MCICVMTDLRAVQQCKNVDSDAVNHDVGALRRFSRLMILMTMIIFLPFFVFVSSLIFFNNFFSDLYCHFVSIQISTTVTAASMKKIWKLRDFLDKGANHCLAKTPPPPPLSTNSTPAAALAAAAPFGAAFCHRRRRLRRV